MKRILFVVVGLFVLIVPAIIFLLPSIPFISNYFSQLHLSNGEFFDVILNFLSLEITLALGIAVYCQSQKINKLEISQYQTYIDVEDLDYSYTFTDQLLLNLNSASKELSISHFFTPKKKEVITNINLLDDSTIPTKNKVFPLVFVVKNKPIINSINIQRISVELIHKGKQILKRNIKSKNDPLYLTLCEGNSFIVGFGLTYSETYSFDEIRIVFSLIVEDQIGNRSKLSPFVLLNKDQNETFFLIRQ